MWLLHRLVVVAGVVFEHAAKAPLVYLPHRVADKTAEVAGGGVGSIRHLQ